MTAEKGKEMGLFFRSKKKKAEYEEGYYADLYEEFYGKRPDHKLTSEEEFELDDLDEDEWEEDEFADCAGR